MYFPALHLRSLSHFSGNITVLTFRLIFTLCTTPAPAPPCTPRGSSLLAWASPLSDSAACPPHAPSCCQCPSHHPFPSISVLPGDLHATGPGPALDSSLNLAWCRDVTNIKLLHWPSEATYFDTSGGHLTQRLNSSWWLTWQWLEFSRLGRN